jgi:hypothetical protein
VIVGLLVTQQMTLQLDADVRRPEGPHQAIDEAGDTKPRPVDGRAACQRHEAAYVPVEIIERECAFSFWRPQLHDRDEPAEILITLARGDEDGQTEEPGLGTPESRIPTLRRAQGRPELRRGTSPDRHRQLRADDRLHSGAAGGKMKARNAVHAIAIEQRERRIPELGGALDERFGQRRAVEEGKRGGGMEFEIHILSNGDCGLPIAACPLQTADRRSPIADRRLQIQSSTPSRNHVPLSRSRNRRHTEPSLSATSHSSRCQ